MFITDLAFVDEAVRAQAKLAVLAASILAAALSTSLLLARPSRAAGRAEGRPTEVDRPS